MLDGFSYDQAMAEAARCLLCHDAPCSKECPASTDPASFIRKMRFRNLKGAVAVIKENNVLGGTCAVICPTCDLCTKGCVAAGLDRPIDIARIQRFLVEYAWDIGFSPLKTSQKAKNKENAKVAIIGSGPSGLTCAAALAQEGCEVTVFERQEKPGGMLQYAIPDHRLAQEFFNREVDEVRELGVEIRCNAAIESKEAVKELLAEGYRAVYVATGTWESPTLDVPNRSAEGVFDALSFLKMSKVKAADFQNTVSDKSVAVIGGGDTAMDAAVTAVKAGARDVSILYRRSFNEMPGSAEEKERTFQSAVNFAFFTQPTDYEVKEGKLTGIKAVRTRLGEEDASGRRRPEAIDGTSHLIPADVVVEALGLAAEEGNKVLIGGDNVFAGGDAVRGPSLVSYAVADGKSAATSILKSMGFEAEKR